MLKRILSLIFIVLPILLISCYNTVATKFIADISTFTALLIFDMIPMELFRGFRQTASNNVALFPDLSFYLSILLFCYK